MAHKELWRQLAGLDGYKTAKRAKCQYISKPERYVVRLLNSEYVVNLSAKQIVKQAVPPVAAGFLEQLCILSYLINAEDVPLANKLVGPETLPGGQFFFRGIHKFPTERLERAFGDCPEGLYRIAGQFDGQRCEFGDASIRLCVLPRIPLTIVIWRGDDEFPARASILFDRTAAKQLPLDALATAVSLAVDAMVGL